MKNIPNLLSLLRILLVPFIVQQMYLGNMFEAGVLLILSGLTDLLDGKLARKYNWITDLGKIIDPAADKLTQTAVSIMLAIQYKEYWYFFAFMICKDIVMLVLGSYLMVKKVQPEGSKWFGKVATFVYYLAVILIILIPNLARIYILLLLLLATVCAIIAALLYIPDFIRYKQDIKTRA